MYQEVPSILMKMHILSKQYLKQVGSFIVRSRDAGFLEKSEMRISKEKVMNTIRILFLSMLA